MVSSKSEAPAQAMGETEQGRAALLIVDMINRFDFPGADILKPRALAIMPAIEMLIRQFDALEWPVIYVNDNFGEWHSDRSVLIERALEGGNQIARRLRPRDTDYFILKPQFSGFYATNLPVLLPKLGATRLVLTGIAADICILFTAADAHMRDYSLWVPANAVAAESEQRQNWALEIMKASMGARTDATAQLELSRWRDETAFCEKTVAWDPPK
ncbi:nicotinamidase-related amidase [Novosphingobium sp. PhB165]|uniref:cysteine hydrolase family protein n=1 Tax=Novosphingobium sp. PhB165 TaxID=2485105 RepID=UPI0010E495E4|nr:isochorismatase family cysteine hydrolase [Novosphingobium sp. PhB165]TCM14360.1 nicotinamidase-related amidase [Novosphingobium sp. PhB165]